MGVSIFHSKSAILAISAQKVRKSAFLRTFAPQNALFRSFRSKTLKTGMGQKCCSSQCFFRCFGGHFRKKAQNGGFLAFWTVLTTFGGQKLLLRPKSEKAQKSAKDEKASFSLRAQNSEKRNVLGTFLEPKTPKITFSAFGPTFPFWSVLGAKSAPEAKNEFISTFWLQKVGKSRFCDSGRKRVPKTLRLSRVLRFWRK